MTGEVVVAVLVRLGLGRLEKRWEEKDTNFPPFFSFLIFDF